MASLSEIVFEDSIGKKYTTHSDYDHSIINDMVSDEDLVPMDAESVLVVGEMDGKKPVVKAFGIGTKDKNNFTPDFIAPMEQPLPEKNTNYDWENHPSSPLEEVPATVPSPAEPTNANFDAEGSNYSFEPYTDYGGFAHDTDDCRGTLRFEEDSRIGVCEDCGEKVKISEKDYDWIMNEWFGAESKNKNTKMVIGITALGIGLAFWKGKDLLSLWDRIKEKME
jgi:hypothetical protein